MQALKALIIFMGILIFVAMGFLVYGLLTLDDDKDPPKPTAGRSFGLVESQMPAGASVSATLVEDGRVVISLRLADGGVEIRIFDLVSGAALGVIRLDGAP
jgi:hypothetical protein